jgi:hypothetical protein
MGRKFGRFFVRKDFGKFLIREWDRRFSFQFQDCWFTQAVVRAVRGSKE